MSTILKSLKKLEQEKEATRFPTQASGYSGPGAMSGNDGSSSGWTKGTWIRRSLVTLIILCLGASSFYFYKQSQNRSTAERNQVIKPEPQAKLDPREKTARLNQRAKAPEVDDPPVRALQKQPIQKPIPKTNEQLDSRRQQPSQRELSPAPEQIRPAPAREQTRSAPAPEQIGPAPAPEQISPATPPNRQVVPISPPQPATTPPVVQEKGIQAPSTTAPPSMPEELAQPQSQRRPVPIKPAPAKPSPKRPDPYSGLRALGNGRLKIHAIVWSTDKEERMAVVNSQIVHEGDGVDGYAVVAIRQDDLVVRDEAGSLWKVKFGRP